MKIKLTSVYVDDQEKALRFYTDVLGFVKKSDFSQGPYRWLTVASAEEEKGTELQLALNDDPVAKSYQQAMRQQGKPAAMFYTDDVKGTTSASKRTAASSPCRQPT
jgi:catechol 2,3-dioxygenase-like lactoylglutathione lyase family enzyme